jgi:hypothetical protein
MNHTKAEECSSVESAKRAQKAERGSFKKYENRTAGR